MKSIHVRRAGIAAAVAGVAGVIGTALLAQDGRKAEAPAAEAPERAAVEAIVRDYLLDNPEIIIEALERYREREAQAANVRAETGLADHLATLSSGALGAALGASEAEAEVLVVEFFDYHCGFCRRAADFVMEIADEDGVRVVLQDMPILRDESDLAALAGLAAEELGGFSAMHLAMMRQGGTLDRAAIERAAAKAGLTDLAALLDDEEARAALQEKLDGSLDIAADLGLGGTPAFLIASPDGRFTRLVPGYAPDQVRAAIAEARRG